MLRNLNVGCGDFPLEPFVNLDIVDVPGVDIVMDFFEFAGMEPDSAWDHIRADHWLEHLTFAEGETAMMEFFRLLRPGGLLVIEVPDMERIFAGDTGGFGIWTSVYGVQIHEGELHKSGYYGSTLTSLAARVGFTDVIVTAYTSDHPARAGFPCLLLHCVK